MHLRLLLPVNITFRYNSWQLWVFSVPRKTYKKKFTNNAFAEPTEKKIEHFDTGAKNKF